MVEYKLPLNEVVFDFYDRLKSITKGYASFDYEITGYEVNDLVKVSVMINGDPVDALSLIVHRDRAQSRGRTLCERLKDLIPRQQFKVAIQAAIGGKIIARETVASFRKDVTQKLYGGDVTRKNKLLDKQKKGKKRMRQFGKVDIPQNAFLNALKNERKLILISMVIENKIEQIISLKKEGKIIESEKLLRSILDNQIDDYDKLLSSALLLIKKKNFNESIIFLKKAISINSSKNEAYINLANIYIILKEYSKGIEFLNIAYKNDPLNKDIINNLSYLTVKINDNIKALDLIEKGLELDPSNYFLLNLKGRIYIDKNLIEEGIAFFIKSIETKCDFWNAYENLFFILESTNNIKLFREYINIAKNIFFNNQFLNFFEAQLLFREKKFDTTINFLQEKDLEKKLNDFHNYLILYYDLLAKCFEKINNYKSSFHYFELRNNLRKDQKENKKFDKNIILDLISNYNEYFIEENINKYKISPFNKNNIISPVFLMGFPRSGTTLLDSILRSHSCIEVLEEKPFISKIRDKFFKSHNNLINSLEKLDSQQILSIQTEYLDLLNIENDFLLSDKIIIDKFPLNIIEIGFIKRIFPNSKFIISLRHPCDVILSCFTSNFKINEGMANFYDLESSAILYNEVFLLFQHYRNIFDIDYFMIKYEDVIKDFKPTINNLLNFLNLKWEDNLTDFNNTALNRNKINTPSYSQVIQPLYDSSINRWKNYKEINNIYPTIEKWIEDFNY